MISLSPSALGSGYLTALAHGLARMAADAPEQPSDATLEELFDSDDVVPFVYWREFTGARVLVLFVGAIAVLSFLTGLSALSNDTGTLTGPLAAFLPAAERVSAVLGLFGIFTSFLLAGLAVGLQRGLRVAWYGTIAVLAVLALWPLVAGGTTTIPVLAAAVVALPLLARHRATFDGTLDLGPFQIAALATFAGVQIYGTIGAYTLRADYTGIRTWIDAFYYIVVTGATVGYGDATPTSQMAKLFTLSVIIIGTTAFGAVFGSLVVPALEARLTSAFGTMTASELKLLEDHVLVLGYGDLTEPLIDELDEAAAVVVVTDDPAAAALDDPDRDVELLTADPTDESSLDDAGIGAASGVVVATGDDAETTLAVLAARQANPDIRIVAAATDPRHVDKLRGVGADEVVSPSVIGGQLLGESVLDDGDADSDSDGDGRTGGDSDGDDTDGE